MPRVALPDALRPQEEGPLSVAEEPKAIRVSSKLKSSSRGCRGSVTDGLDLRAYLRSSLSPPDVGLGKKCKDQISPPKLILLP